MTKKECILFYVFNGQTGKTVEYVSISFCVIRRRRTIGHKMGL
jgi:hypothetical protein